MTALLDVILPVFLVIGFGYFAVRAGLFSEAAVDGLMRFTQDFAIPCLLFRAISGIDLAHGFDLALLASFYSGALAGFLAGLLGGRYVFGRAWEDSVAIGFCGLFSNAVLLGLPISERAFGADSLRYNYAIVAIHAPFCYGVGVTAMELIRARGRPLMRVPGIVASAMFRNALVIGIALGFAFNLSSLTLPLVVSDALDLMVRAALPAALFGLGGVLVRYSPEGDLRAIAWVCCASLMLHPGVAFLVGRAAGLGEAPLRASVLTAAMAPGVNAYVFANLYGRARRVAASGVLVGTAASLVSIWIWLLILG